MIEKLVLKNFQAHKKTELEFCNGLNAITGESDQGKSSIIRALYWMFFNKPSGNEFIRNTAQSSFVHVQSDEENWITRLKGKNHNEYKINEEEFNATRNDVPTEVNEVINITSTNIQLQDDPYFLLSMNSPDVARHLNQVVGLENIDNSLQYVNKHTKRQQTAINHIQSDIEKKKAELDKFSTLPDIEQNHEKYKKLTEDYDEYINKIKQIKELNEKISEQKDKIADEDVINKLSTHLEAYLQNNEYYIQIKKTIEKISSTIENLEELQEFIEKIDPIHEQIKNNIQKAEKHQDEMINAVSNIQETEKIIKNIKEIEKEIKTAGENLTFAEENFETIKTELQICPFCESNLKEQ